MSGDSFLPQCQRCGTRDGRMRHNHLIGGWYCKTCDKHITAADPKLEAWYSKRIASLSRRKRPRELET